MRRFVAVLSLQLVCGLASQSPGAVVISYSQTDAGVSDGVSFPLQESLDTGGAVVSASLPGYSSTTTSSFSTAGNSAVLSESFDQPHREGNTNGYDQSYFDVYFSSDVDVPYGASGSYSNSGGFTNLTSYLVDRTTFTYLFFNYQYSQGGPAAFSLGGTAGNLDNFFLGSLTGTLLAGDVYEWWGGGVSQAYPVADLGAAASGGVSLTIETLSAVPEASSLIVWSLLALTIGGARWWQRAKLAAQ
jgi:hypothetical protein